MALDGVGTTRGDQIRGRDLYGGHLYEFDRHAGTGRLVVVVVLFPATATFLAMRGATTRLEGNASRHVQ